jgi:hypothetical protein
LIGDPSFKEICIMSVAAKTFDLRPVREAVMGTLHDLEDRAGPFGCYRSGRKRRSDLYSSLDAALIRVIMGEDLASSLTEAERRSWVDHINSYARQYYDQPGDGSYEDTYGHAPLHANGMVIGALGSLGGQQLYPVTLYSAFDTPEKVGPWLDSLDWSNQWRSSHLFWGGLHCFSFSRACTPEWREAVFNWLNDSIDETTGWWRRGAPHVDRHQPLGGSVHILPMYEHHGQSFPYPERVIDSVLSLQRPNGRWLQKPGPHMMHYLELDALYALKLMRTLAPAYREPDIERALDAYVDIALEDWAAHHESLLSQHPHVILAAVGTFGLLQQHRPEQFLDSRAWSDIFTDRRLYMTSAVEQFARS